MKTSLLPGVIRGLGKARIRFDLIYQNKKISKRNVVKFQFLEKLDLKDKEFSRSSLFKTLKYFSDSEPDEVIFWTVLKLINAEELGSICLPQKNIQDFILNKNPTLNPEATWKEYFQDETSNLLYRDGDMIYLSHIFHIEVLVCNYLKSFFNSNLSIKFKPYKNKNLSDEQVSIVNEIFKNSLSFLSGGPGTGKTTIIQAILNSGIENGIDPEDIAILAPTGKAAKRLQESCVSLLTKYESLNPPSTIHRFLGYNPSTGKFKLNADNPIPKKLLIIDESSMIDLFILKALLEAYPNTSKDKRLIFVGDPDQLLSVNTGSVFSDLVAYKKNTFKLTKSFRQSTEGEEIKSIALKMQSISTGDNLHLLINSIPMEKEFKGILTGVRFIESSKDITSIQFALEWYQTISKLNLEGQILTPYNESEIGVKNVNTFLQEKIEMDEKLSASQPVIVNTNLYDLELFNGETGYLKTSVNGCSFTYSKKEIQISNSHLQYFEPAFAITVHKSQGSEYEHVCLLLPAELENPDSLLNIRILYTAITRAKKSVTVIGSFPLFQKALLNKGEERHSKIQERLS